MGGGGNTNPNMNQLLANMWSMMNGNFGGTARSRKPRIHILGDGDVSKTLPNVEGDSKQPLQLEWTAPGNLFASTNHFSVSVSVFMVQTCLNFKPRETTSIKMSVHSNLQLSKGNGSGATSKQHEVPANDIQPEQHMPNQTGKSDPQKIQEGGS